MPLNSQLECFISALHNHSKLKFVYGVEELSTPRILKLHNPDVDRLASMPCHHEPLPNAKEFIEDQDDTADIPHAVLWRFGKAESASKSRYENSSFFSRNILAFNIGEGKVSSIG